MTRLFILPLLFILLYTNISFGQRSSYFVQFSELPEGTETIENLPGVLSFECPFSLSEMQTTYVLKLSDAVKYEGVKNKIDQNYHVNYIEAIPEYKLFYTPNDLNSNQYNLDIIQAENAWDIDSDASDVKIAIVDDAVDITHPDLSSNIWTNTGEIAGNAIDDDGNGYVDDINGWDCADNDNDVTPPASPVMEHGTHVAGISSASTGNSNGIAAIGIHAKIIPVKIGSNASGGLQNSYLGVDYAIQIGADIINMSWGGGAFSQTYQNLFDLAYANNIVCVAAAGNSSTSTPMYPASYNHVISVAATDQNDMKAGFSNYGSTIDVAAPGKDIYSTVLAPTLYDNKSGTSMASPLVAGLTALMRSTNPLASVDEIEICLESTCDPVQGNFSTQVGAGRINAFMAMQCISQIYADFTADFTTICPGFTVNFTDMSYGNGLTYNWTFPGGTPASSTAQNPTVTYNTAGTYDVTLEVSDGTNSDITTYTNYITVSQPTAVISGNSTVNGSGYAPIYFNFTGNPPWDVTVTDGTNTFNINGISTSPYAYYVSPGATTTYTISNFNDSQCTGTTSGSANVTHIPGSGSGCIPNTANMIKYMGTNQDDHVTGVTKLGSNGYAVIGRQYDGTEYHFYMSVLDLCGNAIWEKIFNTSIHGIPAGVTYNNGFIYVTTSRDSPLQTSLVKMDLNGNVVAADDWGDGNAQYPRRMIESNSGDLIYAGVSNSVTYSFGSNDFYVMKTDHDANIIWEQQIGDNANDFGHNVEQDANGDIIAVGYTRNYIAGLRKGLVVKLDNAGNVLWSKEYHKGSNYTFIGFVKEIGGAYYLSGLSNSGTMGDYDGMIIKTDLDGNVIWSKFYGGAGADKIATVEEFNGDIYFTGISNSPTKGQEVIIGTIDPANGNILSYTSLGTAGDDNIPNAYLNFDKDANGFYGVFHGDAGIGGTDIVFYRFTSINDNCDPSDVVLNSIDANIQVNNFSASVVSPSWNFNPTTYSSVDVSNNQGYICSNITSTNNCSLIAGFDQIVPTCFEDSVTFMDTTLYDSLNILYLWDFGDGSPLMGTNDTAISHNYSTAGNYPVQLIAIDTTTSCRDTVTTSINLSAVPTIYLSDTVGICLNDTAYIDLLTDCASGFSVNWTSGGPNIVNQSDSSVTATAGASGMIYLELTDGTQSFYDSVFIEVDPSCCTSYPSIEIDNASAFCIGSDVIFINNSTSNSTTAPSYNWEFLPDGTPLNYNGATPPAIQFASVGQKNIVLEMTDDCGTFYDTLLISIFPDPEVDLPVSDTLCFAELIQLGDDPIAGFTYQWSPAGIVSDPAISNPTAWVSNSDTLYLTVTDEWTGCSATDSIIFHYDSTDVDLLMNDTIICGNEELNVPYTIYNSNDLYWTPANQLTNITTDSATFSINQYTLITATSTGLFGCQSSDSVFIDLIPLKDELDLDTVKCEFEDFVYTPEVPWEINGTVHETIVIEEIGDHYFTETNECYTLNHHIHLEEVSCSCNIYVPNAFTPTVDDGTNDSFLPSIDCPLIDYQLNIYNRWGEVVFSTNNIYEEWDGTYNGKLVQNGAYTWSISYMDPFTELQKELVGHVIVLK